jgi:hypothetical protein
MALAEFQLSDVYFSDIHSDGRNRRRAKRIMENTMSSVKETMAEIIARQPDDSSFDEILRELAFARMVQRGLGDSDAGRTVSDDAIERKVDSWRR